MVLTSACSQDRTLRVAGQIEHAETTLRQIVIDLDNLNHTLRLFTPDIDLEEIRPKPLPPRLQA